MECSEPRRVIMLYSTVPVFKSFKSKSHTLRPPRPPLDATLRWDESDRACFINTSRRKLVYRKIKMKHTGFVELACSLTAALCCLFLPPLLCSLSLERLMWEWGSLGPVELWSHLAENSEPGQGQHREICPGQGGAKQPGFPQKPRLSEPRGWTGLGWWFLPLLPLPSV